MNRPTHEEHINKIQQLLARPQKETAAIMIPFYLFYRKIFGGMSEQLKNMHDLTNSEIDVLGTLHASEADHTLSPTQLYQQLLFSSGGMTKVLARLEAKGAIERVENPGDRRSKLVRLTDDGKCILENAIVTALSYEGRYLDALNHSEKEHFRILLEKLLASDPG